MAPVLRYLLLELSDSLINAHLILILHECAEKMCCLGGRDGQGWWAGPSTAGCGCLAVERWSGPAMTDASFPVPLQSSTTRL